MSLPCPMRYLFINARPEMVPQAQLLYCSAHGSDRYSVGDTVQSPLSSLFGCRPSPLASALPWCAALDGPLTFDFDIPPNLSGPVVLVLSAGGASLNSYSPTRFAYPRQQCGSWKYYRGVAGNSSSARAVALNQRHE